MIPSQVAARLPNKKCIMRFKVCWIVCNMLSFFVLFFNLVNKTRQVLAQSSKNLETYHCASAVDRLNDTWSFVFTTAASAFRTTVTSFQRQQQQRERVATKTVLLAQLISRATTAKYRMGNFLSFDVLLRCDVLCDSWCRRTLGIFQRGSNGARTLCIREIVCAKLRHNEYGSNNVLM